MSFLQQATAILANPPSFVDLRQFARDRSKGIAVTTAAGEDRFLSRRRVLDWAPGGPVTAGVITLEAGQGSVSSLSADEFILVNEGSLTLSQQDATLTLAPGQSAVIPQGAAFSWSAQADGSTVMRTSSSTTTREALTVP